jgi:hypothetical protein
MENRTMSFCQNTAAMTGLIVAALVAGIVPAAADPAAPSDQLMHRVFGKPLGDRKIYACFIRRYDAAHLAQHPKQKVSGMKVLLAAERDAQDESLRLSFRMGVNLRNRKGTFESAGDCQHPEVIQTEDETSRFGCGVDCDGGGIEAALTKDDKSLVVSLEEIRIWRRNDDSEGAPRLKAGADDHSFRLDRTKLIDCGSLTEDRKELAVLRRQ